jgi:hypothetical protein
MIHRSVVFVLFPTLAVAIPLTGCKAPQPFGDRNVVIVRANSALWEQVDSSVMNSLERRVFTTRPERTFEVTFVADDDALWIEMRAWQQVVVLGTFEDEVVRRIVNSNVRPPALVQTRDVWARGQDVTVILLPEEGQAEAVDSLLPQLFSTLDARYQVWITERMFTTGVNDSLAEALAAHGFTLQVPNVYIHGWQDSVLRVGNPYRQGDTDLLRSLVVAWQDGVEDPTPESLRAWREAMDDTQYTPGQDIQEEGASFEGIEVDGLVGLEFRGVWRDRADFPAAGPFIARAVPCPHQNRTYYMDAWVFAPGKDKYPYVRQLEILLDSFRCTEEGPTAMRGAGRDAAIAAAPAG